MSNASGNDRFPSAGEGTAPASESLVSPRRRALKAMLGSAPVVLTFPSVTQAASSASCQDDLNAVQQTSPPEPISETNMTTPAWFRLVVTKQTYSGNRILYKYQTGTTTWYYLPPDYTRYDTRPSGYNDANLQSETTVYVLADVSSGPPYEPDFDGGGTYSTMSCMMSMPSTPA